MIAAIVILGFTLKNSSGRKSASKTPTGSGQVMVLREPALTPEQKIEAIVAQAKRGATPNFNGIAGQTTTQEVEQEWNASGTPTETEAGSYTTYPEQGVTIGVRDGIVFDVRYAGGNLKGIHYNDLKTTLGNPDKTKTYKDVTHDQIIWVYQVSSDYQLKWILQKPTDTAPNPVVDHIAVWTKVETKHEKLLSELTLDEKIGQLIIAGIDGTTVNNASKELIAHYKIGGVIFYSNNADTPDQTLKFVNSLKAVNQNNKLPLFTSIDQEGGRVARLPKQVAKLPRSATIGKRTIPIMRSASDKC